KLSSPLVRPPTLPIAAPIRTVAVWPAVIVRGGPVVVRVVISWRPVIARRCDIARRQGRSRRVGPLSNGAGRGSARTAGWWRTTGTGRRRTSRTVLRRWTSSAGRRPALAHARRDGVAALALPCHR